MKIVLPDQAEITNADRALLQTLGDVTIYDDVPDSDEEIVRRVAGAELIGVSWVDISDRLIKATPTLNYIVALAVGYDQIDVAAATAAGVRVINCPTHNAPAVAEFTLGLIFAVTRRLLEANRALCQGEWDPRRFVSPELKGKTLGLIGHGTIGRAVEAIATSLGMTVKTVTSRTSADELDALIASVDILSLHLPLRPTTRHLVGDRRLRLMKPSAYLINTARGAIVDQTALLAALKEGRLAGAALDVFDAEPVTGAPNAEILELASLPNVVATPHIAYNTSETAERLGAELIANIRACINGAPINVVNG